MEAISSGRSSLEHLSLLTDLSTELLLLIFEYLPPSALLAVSKSSQRFHYLALPVYLAYYKIPAASLETGNLTLDDRAMEALPGLQCSLSLTSLKHLSCKFSGLAPDFARQVRHLIHLILKLDSVQAVTLDLGNIDSRWIDGLLLITSDDWKANFLQLLTKIIEKGSLNLVLANGHFLVNSQKPKGLFRESVSSIATFLKPSPTSSQDSPHLPPLQLQKFSIHSSLFFIEPFYDWFIEKLAMCSIHTLSLRLSGIPQDTWSATLSSITIPSLSHFSAESVDIRFADLMKFLARHPSIETLDLHPNFVYSGPRKLGRPMKWPHPPKFRSLSGCPENVRDLLHTLKSPMPPLHTIGLSLPTQQSTFRAMDFGKLGGKISAAIQGVVPTELHLKFLVPHSVDSHSRTQIIREKASPRFPSVRTLKLSSDGHFAFTKWILPGLPQWLETFSALQQIIIAGDCAPLDAPSRAVLVQSISFSCPGVTSVVIGEEDYLVI